jgi:beta-galactosidase
MRYGKSNGWLDGQPAMISHKVGEGRITYLGALVDEDLMRKVVQWALNLSEIEPEFEETPGSVEVCRRVGKDREIFVLINHSPQQVTIPMPSGMHDVLNDGPTPSEVVLSTQGVAVLERMRHE